MRELLLIGASGLAREVLSLLRAQSDPRSVWFIDDRPALWGTSIDGVLVVGGLSEVANHPTAEIVICVGRGAGRAALVDRLAEFNVSEGRFARVIHRSVEIPDSCEVGTGSILLAGVAMTTNVKLGQHVVIMPNVTLTHDDLVESFATLCAGVALGGHARIGEGAYLGMNASVREGIRVGRRGVLGMGAVLTQDLPSEETWVGVPAHRLEGARV